ncbi:MAG: uncharacterized protein QOI31_2150 [Solirubrobacterales bacterium]|jgi:DUF2075 family protein|nr:uncharacterized protein [Solirubrobacterales bacterium]
MGSSRIERLPFNERAIDALATLEGRFVNWPVVYTLNGGTSVYVGETGDAAKRLKDHLATPEKRALGEARIVLDDKFNKSACLDLESRLINWFAGDGNYQVLNGNGGQTDRDYFEREAYRKAFSEIFEKLRKEGLFTRSLPEIENQDLFKLSPFKALTPDQALSVEDILRDLFAAFESGEETMTVVQGDPGTGKTVVAIYLMKLLRDIDHAKPDEPADEDARFSEFFAPPYPELLRGLRIGLVVPQQSLRRSVQRVFAKTRGLAKADVVTPFQVGGSPERFDLLIVDEAHRLNQRAAQASGPLNAKFRELTERLFGTDDPDITQLDWIQAMSRHQILFVDTLQSVRPADLPTDVLECAAAEARHNGRLHRLRTQHRVRAGEDYIGYVRAILAGEARRPHPRAFAPYDLRFFDNLGDMRAEILRLDEAEGLARLLAGFAWKWTTKSDRTAYDIELDGFSLRWNGTDRDWVASEGSVEEVGSIHTIQGYDLNYAGVIIGPDLRYDTDRERIGFDRTNYFDSQGMKNNIQRGITYSDEDILRYVRNIYGVLLTRGIRGTFVYVCDDALREYIRPYFDASVRA